MPNARPTSATVAPLFSSSSRSTSPRRACYGLCRFFLIMDFLPLIILVEILRERVDSFQGGQPRWSRDHCSGREWHGQSRLARPHACDTRH
jgi:hypothetical protein